MSASPPHPLILASGSRSRRELLTQAGYRFEVRPSHVDEPDGTGFYDARTYVEHVAWLKAAAVAQEVPAGIVLAADTVGWLPDGVVGKPADAAEARRILRRLGGTTHELWTGVCLWRRPDDFQLAWQEVSRVAFKALSDRELDDYLATRLWEGCSGAYAIQGDDDPFVRLVSGSRSNVVGLPVESLARALREFARL
jgi:septum formation protein